MRILKQTPQELVLRYRQLGQWLVAGGYFFMALGASVVASFIPEIACPGGKQTPSCILTYRSFTGLSWERDVQLKAVRSERSCSFSRNRKSSCNGFTVTLTTDVGDFSFHDKYSNYGYDRAHQFIKNPSETSFQLQLSFSQAINQQPFLFFIECVVIASMLSRANAALTNEEIYISIFNKTKDWVTVTRKQRSGKPLVAINEFPISAIQSVDLGQNYLALKLKSGREVRIATAIWGKKTIAEHPSEASRRSHSFWTINNVIKDWLS